MWISAKTPERAPLPAPRGIGFSLWPHFNRLTLGIMKTTPLALVVLMLTTATISRTTRANDYCPELAGSYAHCASAGFDDPLASTLDVNIEQNLSGGVTSYRVILNTAYGVKIRDYVNSGKAVTTQIGTSSDNRPIWETNVSRCNPAQGGLIIDSVVQTEGVPESRLKSRIIIPYRERSAVVSIQYIYEDEHASPMGATAINCVKKQ